MFVQEFKRYWKEVERNLTCSRASRKKFYRQTMKAASQFLGEQPEASFEQVKEYLGSPQDLAQNYLETVSISEIQQYQKNRKIGKLLLISFTALIVIVIGCGIYYQSKRPAELIYVDTVIIDEGDISVPESSFAEE